MTKAFILGIAASFFFAFTFILNQQMNLSGGSWLWSSSLRYIFMLPILLIIMITKNQLTDVLKDIIKMLEQKEYYAKLRESHISGVIGHDYYSGYRDMIGEILEEDVNKLSTLTISNTLMHINKIFKEVLPKLDTLEWREQKLYLLDPFLLFYLRWRNK